MYTSITLLRAVYTRVLCVNGGATWGAIRVLHVCSPGYVYKIGGCDVTGLVKTNFKSD